MDLALCTGAQSCLNRKRPAPNCWEHGIVQHVLVCWSIQSSFHWNIGAKPSSWKTTPLHNPHPPNFTLGTMQWLILNNAQAYIVPRRCLLTHMSLLRCHLLHTRYILTSLHGTQPHSYWIHLDCLTLVYLLPCGFWQHCLTVRATSTSARRLQVSPHLTTHLPAWTMTEERRTDGGRVCWEGECIRRTLMHRSRTNLKTHVCPVAEKIAP